ncbi:SGNH/GDSL hydrolase family protein [Fictibacillus sp. 18YEL24]|uniref:SGNH/GDSL hydrolase family protein n=1 Tax=Fictibacillus sp. 18YEL24 TaxID=2745875 RepID=UPI0018CFDC7C|nr:SGNH/GDSL hydrolase family protein [Fictibacillus sp. 18YEL24]MBH0169288.1 SGNH/GDSL hydrolase family protein [Fictibacillus sp. 18YEL24]
MADSLFVLNKVITETKKTNPEVITMLQPSNPISKPVKYAEQVEALEAFAAEKAIPYLNNWKAWPSVDSEDIKKYYDSETLLPNEEGHKLWADYMIAIFK